MASDAPRRGSEQLAAGVPAGGGKPESTSEGHPRESVYEAHVGLLPYEDSYRASAVVVPALTAFERRYEA